MLLVGGTGRTGGRVLQQLLGRGVNVRAIVRSAERLPAGVATNPRLTVVEADLLSLSDEDLQRHVRGCDAVISCLGHVLNLQGIFGPPRDLVTQATTRLCRAIEAVQPGRTGQVHPHEQCLGESPGAARHAARDVRESGPCDDSGLLPPAKDNQRAADFLCGEIGADNPFVQWVAVRPDTLLDGDVIGVRAA